MTQPGGPRPITGELLNTAPNTPAPPGAVPLPLPTTGPVQTTPGAPPPDFKALGKQEAQAQFAAEFAKNGYKFDPDALQGVIDELDDALYELRNVQVRRTVKAPGQDMTSTHYAQAATASVNAFNDAHNAKLDYLQGYVDTLRSVRDAYLRQDHAALEALRGAAGKD